MPKNVVLQFESKTARRQDHKLKTPVIEECKMFPYYYFFLNAARINSKWQEELHNVQQLSNPHERFLIQIEMIKQEILFGFRHDVRSLQSSHCVFMWCQLLSYCGILMKRASGIQNL